MICDFKKLSLLLASLLCLSAPAIAEEVQRDWVGLPGPPDTSLWYRYTEAGSRAFRAHQDDLAKRYLFAALTELEKTLAKPHKHDIFLAVKMSTLEQGIQSLYPDDWSKAKNSDDKAAMLKLHQEQVAVLGRIAKLNQEHIKHFDAMVPTSQARYQKAKKDLDKFVADSGQSQVK